MLVARVSPLTGVTNTIEIPINEGQYIAWFIGTTSVQQSFPWLSEDHCEFLMTGLTPEDWANIFNK